MTKTKEGRNTRNVARNAPSTPLARYPTKVVNSMNGPGDATLNATPSSNWPPVSQRKRSTAPRSTKIKDAYAPPKLNSPVLRKSHDIASQPALAAAGALAPARTIGANRVKLRR